MSGCILVAVDGGTSVGALMSALDLAQGEDARVRAVGLRGELAVGMVRASSPDGAALRRRAEIAAALGAAASRAEKLGVPFEAIARSGPPEQVLLEEALRCDADRVVVEAAHHGGPRWRRPRALRRAERDLRCGVVRVDAEAARPTMQAAA